MRLWMPQGLRSGPAQVAKTWTEREAGWRAGRVVARRDAEDYAFVWGLRSRPTSSSSCVVSTGLRGPREGRDLFFSRFSPCRQTGPTGLCRRRRRRLRPGDGSSGATRCHGRAQGHAKPGCATTPPPHRIPGRTALARLRSRPSVRSRARRATSAAKGERAAAKSAVEARGGQGPTRRRPGWMHLDGVFAEHRLTRPLVGRRCPRGGGSSLGRSDGLVRGWLPRLSTRRRRRRRGGQPVQRHSCPTRRALSASGARQGRDSTGGAGLDESADANMT